MDNCPNCDAMAARAQEKITALEEAVRQCLQSLNAAQAKIDSLMLEFCPEDMTPEQVSRWAEHQVVSAIVTKPGESLIETVRAAREKDKP